MNKDVPSEEVRTSPVSLVWVVCICLTVGCLAIGGVVYARMLPVVPISASG